LFDGRSFTIRHENSTDAPHGGEITMTPYSVGNKTSLSQKPCIPDKTNAMERYQYAMVALPECVMKIA